MNKLLSKHSFLLVFLICCWCSSGWSQLDVSGVDTQVNTTTANKQNRPTAAQAGNGQSVIVWESSGQDGDGYGVFGQLYTPAGTATGSEFQINTATISDQRMPDVASSDGGAFAVTWMDDFADGDGWSVYYRVYDAAGTAQTSAIRANSGSSGNQKLPSIAMDHTGAFCIAWMSENMDGDDFGIVTRWYNASGAALTSEVVVNDSTVGYQGHPDVARDSAGNFVIVWQSEGYDGSGSGIFAKIYDNTGSVLVNEFQVNTTTAGNQQEPSVGMDSDGNMVISWSSWDAANDLYQIYARRFDLSGNALSGEFLVSSSPTFNHDHSDVAMTREGKFAISWSSYAQDGSRDGVYVQAYNAAGTTLGGETLVNTTTANYQQLSGTAWRRDSLDVILAWQSGLWNSTATQDGDEYGVFWKFGGTGDTDPPNAVCQNITAYLDGTGNATISGADVDGGSSDNVGIVSYTLDVSSFNCSNIGANAVVLTVEDAAGNTANCGATVTVLDTTSPTAVCQNINVYLDGTGSATITAADLDGGSSDVCGLGTSTASTSSFTCTDIGANSVVFTANDVNGNSATCTSTVTVLDTTSPNPACANLTAYLDGTGNATISAGDVDNGSSDNCGIASSSLSTSAFTCSNIGANATTMTVTDNSGNTADCNATITVLDTTSPTAVCQSITVQLNAAGTASITAADVDGGSSDACGVASLAVNLSSFSCANVGSNSVTLTVTDVNGNTSNCTANVTVEDNVAPTAVCQNITAQLDAAGAVIVSAANVDNGSSDACGVATLAVSPSTFTCSDIGANSVTLTVTDANGNASNCNATVTVEDNVAPTAVCQNITAQLDAAGSASITAASVDNGSSDACGLASTSIDISSFSCANVGANTVTLTVTDVNGNSSNCTSTVTVEDNVAPTAVCQNITAQLDATGTVSITASDVNNGSSDACGIASTSIDVSAFACANVGVNNVGLTVTDVNGNSSNCAATVTVEDNVAPTALCQDVTVSLDAAGSATVSAATIDGGSSDACGIASSNVTGASFSCASIGVNTATLTVTDVNGNASSCTSSVTVQDNTAPTALCADITVQLDATGSVSIASTDVDNGSSDNCGILSQSIDVSNFSCANVGSNTVTLTVNDVNGNSSNCTSTVTVEDNVAPTAVCQDITAQLDAAGAASIAASDVNNGSSDACGIASTSIDVSSFACANVGSNTVTLTVTDVNGNSSNCTSTVTVEDNVAPTAVCQNVTISLDATGSASVSAADIDGGSSDACGIASLSVSGGTFSCALSGVLPATLTVTDVNGNSSSCISTVTVGDNTAPTSVCQDITVQLDAAGSASITTADVDNGSSDNCSIASQTLDVSSFTCANVGSNTVTMTVTDQVGNSSNCTSTVTVEDNVAPTAVCQNVTISLDANGSATVSAADIDGGSSDACGIASLSVTGGTFSCALSGVLPATLTVTDVNGNSSSCISTVTVGDNTAPTSVCQDITVQLDAAGSASITTADVDNGSSDNCSIASQTLDVSSFTCANVGSNTVTMTVTDQVGNSSNCTSVVTVEDNVAPTAVCQNVTISLDANGSASVSAADIDGGSSDACGIASLSVTGGTFSCALSGVLPATLTVTDVNGNSSSCVSSVTVGDNTAPTAVCQDITVQLDAAGSASITASDVDNGSSDNCSIASQTLDVSSFNCASVGSNTVTMTVTDQVGNSSNCTSVVTVEDNIAPTAVCQNITVQLDANGSVSIAASDVDGGSNDNCGISSTSIDVSSFACANVGTNTVNLTVNDVNGNSSNCVSTVTVEDNVAPTAVCQNITVQLDANGSASITASNVDGGSTDNCGIASSSIDVGSFDCSNVGSNTVTLTVTDVNGNASNCTSTVTVEDNVAPSAVCQNITVQLDANGAASITASDVDGGSTDNCGVASTSIDVSNFACANVGGNTVNLTVTDVNGNSSNCVSTVTVEDNVAPTAVCQNITVQLDANGTVSITASDVDGGSTDNCSIASTSIDISSFGCANVGSNTVTLTVTDVNGNSSTCTANVEVEDNVAPNAVCQNITVQLDANGAASITASDVDGGSTDNCGIASSSIDVSSFACANVGSNTVTLTVTDVNGNSSNCTATVTVEDNVAPTAVCQNITVQLDANGSATITAADVDGGSSDNCGIASTSINNSSFNCSNVGGNTVTLTATDVNGNSSTCTSNVTVEDNVAPSAICQNITVQLDANGSASITAADVDGGSSDACGIASLSINNSSFNCSNAGGNTVTLTVTDVNGNSSNCTATVTIEDNVAPTALCQDITIQLDATGNVTIAATDVDGGSTDNCGIVSTAVDTSSFDCDDIGVNPVIMTVTDANGNSSSCSANVTVRDVIAPNAVCQDVTVQLDANGSASITAADIDGGTTDNCDEFYFSLSDDNFNCADVGVNTITLSVVDINGNFASCTANVTVEDNIAPSAVCQNITVQLDANGSVSIAASDVDGGSSDNCGIAGLSVSNSAFACSDIGANTVSLTVSDVNGNSSNCTATVSVEDNVAPTMVCQNITVQLDANGAASIVASDVDGGSNDACGVASLSVNNASFDCSNVGGNTVTLTGTDVNGNSASCSATVTVEDNTAPTAVCQNLTVQLDANGTASITATDVDGGSTDNCGIASSNISNGNFGCADVGANTVTLTVTDLNGNVATCSSTITVEDNIAPVAVCQNITVQLDATGSASITASDVDGGSSDNCGIASASVNIGSFSCSDVGSNPVVLTVTDVNGNQSTCSANVTVEDNTAPTAVCQDITAYLNTSGIVFVTESDIDGGSSDACGSVTLSTDAFVYGCGDGGNNTANLYATDVNGNTDSCQANVFVVDTIPPTITCNDITVALDANGDASIAVNDVLGSLFDNCGSFVCHFDPNVGSAPDYDCSDIGTSIAGLMAIDATGNTSYCTGNVTVIDTIAPTMVCQNLTVQLDANGTAGITVSDVDGGSSDACGIVSISIDNGTFSCANVGANTVTLTATDANGNSNDCMSIVTVEDNIAPIALCQDLTLQLDANGSASIVATDVDNGSTDNCGIASISINNGSFGCGDVGVNTVTMTVTDVNGNSSTCSSAVRVEDNIAPNALCQNLTVQLDATGSAGISASDVDNGSNDNCSIASITIDNGSFGCGDVGANTVTMTVTDVNGNSSNCTSTVTVEDNTAPTAVCQDLTVQLDANGAASIVAGDVDNGSGDNCGIASISIDVGSFACSDVGSNVVTMTVTDVNGNVSNCTSNVNVEDNIAPTALCLNTTIDLDANGQASIGITDVDGGSSDNCGIASVTISQDMYSCADLGVNNPTLTVTDVNGNVSTCQPSVTVRDLIGPVALCQDITIQLDATGATTISPSDVDNGSSDNCSVTLSLDDDSFDCSNVGTTGPSGVFFSEYVEGSGQERYLEIFNATGSTVNLADYEVQRYPGGNTNANNNNRYQLSGTLADGAMIVLRNSAATGTGTPVPNNTMNFSGDDAVALYHTPTASYADIIGVIGEDPGNRWEDGAFRTNQRTLRRLNTVTNGVTVNPPIGNGAAGFLTLSTEWSVHSLNDISDLGNHSIAAGSGNTVVLTVSDPAGNTATCSAIVTVEDINAPTLTCPSDLTPDCVAEIPAIDPLDATVFDNCDANPVVSVNQVSNLAASCPIGEHEIQRVFTATDAEGNVSSCTQTITVSIDTLTQGECSSCDSKINLIQDCLNPGCVFVESECRNINNVVMRDVNGWEYKFSQVGSMSGYFCHPSGLDITDVWVKSGCFRSGDGPNYGYRFDLCGPNSSTKEGGANAGQAGDGSVGNLSLTAFPNPTSGELKVELTDASVVGQNGFFEVKVVDVVGHVLQRKEVEMQSGLLMTEFNLGDYTSGFYFIVVDGGEKQLTTKVVKQ